MSASERSDVKRLSEALASLAAEETAHVDAARVFDALHGTLDVEERRAVVDELVLNAGAAEAWRLARDLAAEPQTAAAPAARGAWRWLSLAAAMVLLTGLGWQLSSRWDVSQEPVYRSIEERTIASQLPPGAVLPRTAPILRWSPVESARYRLRVLTPVLEVLEEADELIDVEYRLTPEVLHSIPPGGRILWQVEARIPGSAVVVSPTFTVTVE